MKITFSISQLLSIVALFLATSVQAGIPLWTIVPLTSNSFNITPNESRRVSYLVTNQVHKVYTLVFIPQLGVNQLSLPGSCSTLFALGYQQSCVLTLEVTGGSLIEDITRGPIICQNASPLQCYEPSSDNALQVTLRR